MIRRAANAVALAGLLLAVAGWVLFLRPTSLGGSATYIVIRGDSMFPTYRTGDLVAVRAETNYAVGDIVAYHVPSGDLGAGRIVVHRISGGDAVHGFLMHGDNNPAADPWMPLAADIVGRPWFVAAGLGRVIAFLHQPVIAAALAAAVMVTFMLARPPRRVRDPDPAQS